MSILALDLARQVGHARWHANVITSGTKSFAPLRGQGTEALFGKWSTWIEAEIREQEIDRNDSIAHLRIETSLFEVDYKSITLKKVLGYFAKLQIKVNPLVKKKLADLE